MKKIPSRPFRCMILSAVMIFLWTAGTFAEDMRDLNHQARQAKEALLQKAEAEEAAARAEAIQSKELITRDRDSLEKALQKLKGEVQGLKSTISSLESQEAKLVAEESELSQKLAMTNAVVRELVGVIRVNAKDLDALIDQSLQTPLQSDETGFLSAIIGEGRFPGMADILRMLELMWQQVKQAGDVRLARGDIVDRAGNQVETDILVLGNFTAAYRTPEEVGFLNYSTTGRKLFALSRLPSHRLQKQLRQYMAGLSEAVPMDVSRGGALSQLVHELSLWQQIPKGGPIVWPILAVFALGMLIVGERGVFLLRKRFNADGLTRRIEIMAETGDWQGCEAVCARQSGKPAARVLTAGLDCRHMDRESMENALQEAILKEVPPMERFLSTLGMLAAIAPLLGLLGTVTGMIDTFHVITRHGTGDPRMMSGGISEALVTTMLGLSVAIPLMLAHTLLGRAVDKHIGQMEEKAVALVNIVEKNRNAPNGASL